MMNLFPQWSRSKSGLLIPSFIPGSGFTGNFNQAGCGCCPCVCEQCEGPTFGSLTVTLSGVTDCIGSCLRARAGRGNEWFDEILSVDIDNPFTLPCAPVAIDDQCRWRSENIGTYTVRRGCTEEGSEYTYTINGELIYSGGPPSTNPWQFHILSRTWKNGPENSGGFSAPTFYFYNNNDFDVVFECETGEASGDSVLTACTSTALGTLSYAFGYGGSFSTEP